MARKAVELGPLAVSRLKKPGLHFVGGVAGLALQVLPTGARTWIFRAMMGAKRRDMGLGGFPDLPLANAREAARKARALIREGIDPIEQAKATRNALKASTAKVMTFREAAAAYIAAQGDGWRNAKHRDQWRSTITTYADEFIGDLDVRDIDKAHILNVLRPIWSEKTETAKRLRGRIERVLDMAHSDGRIPDPWQNPARWKGHLDTSLPKPSKVAQVDHHTALPYAEIGAFMERLRDAEGMGARALEFAILTAARSGEVRGATWAEIDFANAMWVIPAGKMKAGREHRVPLSKAAVKVLEKLPRAAGTDLIFPAVRGGKLSDMTLAAVLRRMKVDAVPHGFRSTFRDWAAEQTAYPHEMAEMALAHAIGNKVEAAYRRGDLLMKRRRMMDDWAAFCAKRLQTAGVHELGNFRAGKKK